MWILKGLLFLVLLFVMVFLVATNQQSVDINFFGRSFLGISIFWVVAVCYLAGVATVFVFSAFREFRFHREIRGLKKTLRLRDKEIGDLRTLPLRDAEPQHPSESAGATAGKEAEGE